MKMTLALQNFSARKIFRHFKGGSYAYISPNKKANKTAMSQIAVLFNKLVVRSANQSNFTYSYSKTRNTHEC